MIEINENSYHFTDDITGRVKNTELPYKDALIPLFEATVNSIQSIEESGNKNLGDIKITIKRIPKSENILGDDSFDSFIDGFIIEDNGTGFDNKNLKSFTTSNSRFKESKGGKGVGRFMWLKVFNKVFVQSNFLENNEFKQRSFNFKDQNPGIFDFEESKLDNSVLKTIIELNNIKKEYQKYIPQNTSLLAEKIVNHHLVYLLSKSCPAIKLIDASISTSINKLVLDFICKENIKTFKIKDDEFELSFIYLNEKYLGSHRISLCAHHREVKSLVLHKYISDIKNKKIKVDGVDCSLIILVKGKYLDDTVNVGRTNFLISADDESRDSFYTNEKDIINKVVEIVNFELSPLLTELKQERIERIECFIRNEEPEYRPLICHATDELTKIPLDIVNDPAKLDSALHTIKSSLERKIKEEGQEFLGDNKKNYLDNPDYKTKYAEYINKIVDLQQSELAKYVIHRKTIIDLLGNTIKKLPSDKYCLEKEVHKLLYPMRASSDEIEFDLQNLWLLDEKLTYHYYLASDLQFNQMDKMESSSADRPDIVHIPNSLVQGEYPYHSAVIIELKRPQRDDYTDEENPIKQVLRYIDQLKEGKVISDSGAHIQLNDQTQFHCYILADLTPKFRKRLAEVSFKRSEDNDLYYLYNENYNAYIEVISYKKLYEDAKKRNRALFEKLKLPTR